MKWKPKIRGGWAVYISILYGSIIIAVSIRTHDLTLFFRMLCFWALGFVVGVATSTDGNSKKDRTKKERQGKKDETISFKNLLSVVESKEKKR